MNCQKCSSERIMSATGKCSDTCGFSINGVDADGYVPKGIGIGGGDYIKFNYCLDCGQIQGKFPVEKCDMEITISKEQFLEFYDICFVEGEVTPARISNHITDYSECLGSRFTQFFYLLFSMNGVFKMPSADTLWEMYQKNNTYIES